MNRSDVEVLFQARDSAGARQDDQLFLSTQISEIALSGSAGYLSLKSLSSEILWFCPAPGVPELSVAMISEQYTKTNGTTHYGQLLYYMVADPDGKPKIADIAWGQSRKS